MPEVFINGFLITISLIFAIGTQNAFVLRQGIKREHVFLSVNVCFLSDSLGIVLGMLFFVQLTNLFSEVTLYVTVLGIIFLVGYGALSFYSISKDEHMDVEQPFKAESRYSIILKLAAATFLNPHYYLDTVFLIGSRAATASSSVIFVSGALAASLTWFYSLGYASGLLRGLFKRPVALKVLHALIGCIMWYIAYGLYKEIRFS